MSKNKQIAKAVPNQRYKWHNNLKNTAFVANMANKKIMFYIVEDDKIRNVGKEFVEQFFPTGIRIIERPFLIKENLNFYALLHRNRQKYRAMAISLMNRNNETKRKRTKFTRTTPSSENVQTKKIVRKRK